MSGEPDDRHGPPTGDAARTAETIADRSGRPRHDVCIVLGTGLAGAADELGPPAWVGTPADLPGLPGSFVSHHRSEVRSVDVDGRGVLVYLGRLHLYEGHSAAEVALPVRAAVAAGCRTVILTNAAGALHTGLAPGDLVLIHDHLNLTGASPLRGPVTGDGTASPFVDLVDAWSPRLRALAAGIDPTLASGIYAQVPGPHFETPAEIRMLRSLGADVVGMSSVLEAIAARHLGAEVLGLSLVTNLGAGLDPDPFTDGSIVAVGEARAPAVGRLLREVVAAS
jgi:purine-nucleoside phosphorylase